MLIVATVVRSLHFSYCPFCLPCNLGFLEIPSKGSVHLAVSELSFTVILEPCYSTGIGGGEEVFHTFIIKSLFTVGLNSWASEEFHIFPPPLM